MTAEEHTILYAAGRAAWLLQELAEEGIARGTTDPLVLQWLRDVEALCVAKVSGARPS